MATYNYKDDIYARLKAGESIETITAQITNDINLANNQYLQEQEQLKAEAEAKEALKNKLYEDLFNDFKKIFKIYGLNYDFDNFNIKDIKESVEDGINDFNKYVEYLESLKIDQEKSAAKGSDEHFDPLEEFLNKFVRE